ncbi:MAG TPA: hypothetical protein VN805_03295 [Caulobacteraceae bacterium]|nr:hypothetical protein [Caulobacteraceae bacterium]
MTLIVCSLSSLADVIAERRPSHVLTLLSPDLMIEPLVGVAPERHLRLTLDDIHEPVPGLIVPDESAVQRVIAFGEGWDRSAPMVVHCFAGVSRSSASALAIACARNPDVDERLIAMTLRRRAPHVFPNRRITAIADSLLDRQGRLIAAVEAMGGDDLEAPKRPVELPSDFAVFASPR